MFYVKLGERYENTMKKAPSIFLYFIKHVTSTSQAYFDKQEVKD